MKDHRYYPVPRRFRERNNHLFHLITAVLILFFTSGSFIRGEERGPEILWDKWGVPHIYGRSSQEMYYAFGRAQMTNHADLILKLYALALGIRKNELCPHILVLYSSSLQHKFKARQ